MMDTQNIYTLSETDFAKSWDWVSSVKTPKQVSAKSWVGVGELQPQPRA